VPPSATRAAIPSCGSTLLQGLLPTCLPPPLGVSTSPGIPCRSAHPFRRSPHSPRGSIPRVTVRVQGFSPSSRFAPPSASRVYFTPLTPFGFPLQGFPLPRSCANSSLASCRRVVAPSVAHSSPRNDETAGAPTSIPRNGAGAFGRLHGFAPLESPCSRRAGLACTVSRAPPGFLPLQGVPRRDDAPAHHRRSSHALADGCSARLPRQSYRRARFGVSFTAPLACLSRGCLPS